MVHFEANAIVQVVVPPTFEEYTTRRVLTTGWLEGEKLSQSQEDDVAQLVNLGVVAYLKQLLDTGFFHVSLVGHVAVLQLGQGLITSPGRAGKGVATLAERGQASSKTSWLAATGLSQQELFWPKFCWLASL